MFVFQWQTGLEANFPREERRNGWWRNVIDPGLSPATANISNTAVRFSVYNFIL
jgi:homoserine acetyltransferase